MIEDGARPLGDDTPLRAIWHPGDTPGHLCFADERHNLMLTGDHVLPRITPNISPSPLTTDDTLGSFLRSLSELARFDPDEVLPAHEYRFSGLPARIRQLHEHHRDRLREILGIVAGAGGCTTVDIAERLSWSRPWDQNLGFVRRSAIGETYAHLVHLERRGMIANASAARPAGGAWRARRDPSSMARREDWWLRAWVSRSRRRDCAVTTSAKWLTKRV